MILFSMELLGPLPVGDYLIIYRRGSDLRFLVGA